MKLQESLFSFENYKWPWDPKCLETQFKHYHIVENYLMKNPTGFITDVRNKTNAYKIYALKPDVAADWLMQSLLVTR